ncbi:uncharacterized protein IL334_003994 [Kwoniella shivajii]|uniref:FAD dependent oxidoreductase domain-containing protein n=1 Tax=Kwoniella shivajii TaxID=564305 RepID=A0ABZ1CZ41_9TREE|nr:hypothetical protein IL334_003994 [Kwoniella shivajii]
MTVDTPAYKSTKIVIVGGGGTFGSSTAYHLVKQGYTPSNITLLDVYPLPSAQSAGNDLNKIFGVMSRTDIDKQLSLESLKGWTEDETFKPFYHNTGELDISRSERGIANLREILAEIDAPGSELEGYMKWVETEDEILALVPTFTRDQIKGWKGIFDTKGGWLSAARAINSIGEYLKAKGVNFAWGGAGTFKQPVFDDDKTTCIGVETTDGTVYKADKVVLAAGAWAPTLVDLEGQCCSKAWVYAHMQLTPEEVAQYKGIPVVYDDEFGFIFEPNENGVIKICDEFPGFTRFKEHQPFGASSPQRISVPRSHAKHPTDTIPEASDRTIAKAVAEFLPQFKDKKLINQALCWVTDTADRNLLICEHPRWQNFIIASGDCGQSFKLLPNIGIHIVELLENRLPDHLEKAWKWRPGTGDTLSSFRGDPATDLADHKGWLHDDERSTLNDFADIRRSLVTA